MQFKISSDINLKEKLQFFFLNLTVFGCHHIHSILFSLSGYTLAMELDFFFFFFYHEKVILRSIHFNMHLSVNQPVLFP